MIEITMYITSLKYPIKVVYKMSDKKLNSYYLYYKNVLKKKNLTPSQLIQEIKQRFSEELDIKMSQWGRTSTYDCIEIKLEEHLAYVIPLLSSEEILEGGTTLGQRLGEHTWVFPPYIQMQYIRKILATENEEELENLCDFIYSSSYFASQLTSTYLSIDLFKDKISLIEEAIDCFVLRKTAASITLLLTIIEGIAREFCDIKNLNFERRGSISAFNTILNYRKEEWRDNILLSCFKSHRKILLPNDYHNYEILRKIDEAMDMFVSFEKYGINYLYKSDSTFSLNRHSILHGTNNNYWSALNFYRLFSCLEMLAVVISSNFMPTTDQEIRKNRKYEWLKKTNFMNPL